MSKHKPSCDFRPDAPLNPGRHSVSSHIALQRPNEYLKHLRAVSGSDIAGLLKAEQSYGSSWKNRGGTGAFMMLARKWDRLEKQVQRQGFDIFVAAELDERAEGVIDDIRDLRRYLLLVESELVARGVKSAKTGHRDNVK